MTCTHKTERKRIVLEDTKRLFIWSVNEVCGMGVYMDPLHPQCDMQDPYSGDLCGLWTTMPQVE